MNKPTKVVFLDYDGVVNTPMWSYDRQKDKWHCSFGYAWEGKVNNLQAVQWVSEFCEKYGYGIVVSSTWRRDNPAYFLFKYFEDRRMFSDRRDEMESWCAALTMCNVRNNGKYVNGFNDRSTQPYRRQREFYKDLTQPLPQTI